MSKLGSCERVKTGLLVGADIPLVLFAYGLVFGAGVANPRLR